MPIELLAIKSKLRNHNNNPMKNKSYYILKTLFFIILFSLPVFSQSIGLPDKWLFKTGDDSSYKEASFNDTGWKSIPVPAAWEDNGYPDYDGFAWYRLHFIVDKKNISKGQYLLVGKIDDIDETYLNGVLIGATGTMPPNVQSEWNTQRAYKIPGGLLKEENVLAVRVYDFQYGGGITQGLVGIYDEKEYIKELNLGPAPKKSFYQITTTNGLVAAVYNEKTNIVENVFPHIFKMYDEDIPVKAFIKNLKLNANKKPVSVSYLQNTHIINLDFGNYSLKLFAPFATGEKIFYAVAEGKQGVISTLSFSYEKNYCEVLYKDTLLKAENGISQKYFLFSFNDSLHNNKDIISKALTNIGTNNLLIAELNYMKGIISSCHIPGGLSEDEKNLYEQSISILKMGQVSQKEIFEKSRGQIIASVPPGNWNIGWLRDGVYSILALNKLGLFTEAKQALSFFLNADAGYYKNFIYTDGKDYGVKVDYKLSVCRYFGIGKEESDFNENGPNIELDGFGLFLIGFSDYITKSKDVKFLNDNYEVIRKLIADPIIKFIESNNLVRMESGPWESHLPGKQFAFTSIVNSAGLKAFAELCKMNKLSGFEKYSEASERLKRGIKENLVYEGKLLKGFETAKSPETMDFYDGGTIEAFNFNIITSPEFFKTYYEGYEKGLRISESKGFSRLNNPDWYTIGEWPFLDLRYSSSLLKYGNITAARKLIDRITNYSKMNFNYVAELYNYKDENYDGAVPMVGYGAGTYIITLNDFYKN